MGNKVFVKITIGFVMITISFGLFYIKNFRQQDIVIEDEVPVENEVVNESIIVNVAGEIAKPSVLTLPNGSRVYEAINVAGGFTEKANITIINLARVLEDEDQLFIPSQEEESNIVGLVPVKDLSNNEATAVHVSIYGEVVSPGVVIISQEARVKDVLDAAGGGTEGSNLMHINLAQKLSDGMEIYISNVDDAVEQNGLVNINTASLSELQSLNGIGEVLAKAIIDHRTQNGSFKKIEDIMKVSGIGQGKFNQIKEYISTY